MSKCFVINLPAMGDCCGPKGCCDPKGGEREFTVKVKVQCNPGDECCRVELSPEGCCEGEKPADKPGQK